MQLTLPNKVRGFTLIEILLTITLVSLVSGGFFWLFNSAESSRLMSIAKAEVQSEVRRSMDWMVNDLRQTTAASINNNLPSNPSMHIKFEKVIGYSVKGGSPLPTPDFGNFIEYVYDSASKTITRIDPGQNPGSWTFKNIANLSQPIFNTRRLNGDIEPLTSGSLITEGNLVIELIGKKEVKLPSTTVEVAYLLKEEVHIRN